VTSPAGPLAGLRIIDVGGTGPVPFCGMLLADLGAEVIAVRRPAPAGQPDGISTVTNGILARGRQEVTLNLKHPLGRDTALDLIAAADALLEGFRPGVMERLGLGPEVCMRRNSRLVYGRMTGWGQDGPYAQRPGHDINYLATSGVLAHIGTAGGPPVPPLNLLGDFGGGGLLLAFGVLAALLETRQSGRGQTIDAAMADGAALLSTMTYELWNRGAWQPGRGSNFNDTGAPFYNVYETADGQYVAIGAMEGQFWTRLLERLDIPAAELPEQWDRAGWPAVRDRLAARFRQHTRAQWCDLLMEADVCFSPVLTMAEAMADPHNVARGAFAGPAGNLLPAPAPRFSRTGSPDAADGRATGPEAGRTSAAAAQVLRAAGISDERIKDLADAGLLV
jgi:alpha-methylacyl-CoA racemase